MSRREDLRLLTGRGRYTADTDLPGQLHAHFLRSDRPHARIASLDVRRAASASGVHAVLTGTDVSNLRWPPCYVTFPGRGGNPLLQPERPIIAVERVRFVGEIVAMVVADTVLAAQDTAELIEVEYEDLPAVVGAEEAITPGAPQLYGHIVQNTPFEFETGDAARTDAAFAHAVHVASVVLESQRVVANPMESRACIGIYDASSGVYALRIPTQGLPMMRASIASMLGVSQERLRIVPQDVGGGFGARSNAEPEYGAVAEAARRLGRPVKWVATRAETFMTDSQGRANRLWGELALDREGGFLALRFRFLCDCGAYLTQTGPLVHTINPAICAGGVYRIPAIHAVFRHALTNTCPVGAYRGAGRPDVTYLIERLVDHAGHEFGFDPVELRRKNLIPRDAFPYTTANGFVYDCGDFETILDKAVTLADWRNFPPRRAEAALRGKLRGIGLATFVEPCGGGFTPKDEVEIRFNCDRTVALYTITQSNGQGHETAFPALVGRFLGIPAECIELRASDPDADLAGSGSFGSRSLVITGGALKVASDKVIAQGRRLAADELGATADEIEFANGEFRVRNRRRSVRLLELAASLYENGRTPLDAKGEMSIARWFPNGCHVAEVEIDPDTGESQIHAYTAVDDFGNVIDPVLVAGQVQGGVAQGAGQVFSEHCIYDRATGQLLTGSFMDYAMPRADAVPPMRLFEHPVPTPNNPLGAKGAGEAGTTGSLAALMNAVLNAVRPAGVEHLDMPVNPHRLWQALHSSKE